MSAQNMRRCLDYRSSFPPSPPTVTAMLLELTAILLAHFAVATRS
jgi:hypothetical protein